MGEKEHGPREMGSLLVNFKNPSESGTHCRFEKIKAQLKIIHYSGASAREARQRSPISKQNW